MNKNLKNINSTDPQSTSNGVKKNKIKNIYGFIGVFIIVFSMFSFIGISLAETIIWSYEVSSVPGRFDFENQVTCGNNRALYLEQNLGQTATVCKSVVTAGEPTIENPYTIEPGKSIELDNVYTLLAPIGDQKEIKTDNIGGYFNILFNIAIGLAGALAVIMIVIGGIQWMGEESIFGKAKGKERITMAVIGLLIALGAYALLNTINPDLLGKKGLNITSIEIKIEGDRNAPVSIVMADMEAVGINCPEEGGYSSVPSIAKSFKGKMTYSQNIPKGQVGSNNTIKYDCSGFVNAVLICSGINTTQLGINSGTNNIFSNIRAEKIFYKDKITATSIDGKPLQVGDLIGWKPSDDDNGNGHVMIYLGNGLVADSHGPSNKIGQAYGEFSLEIYKDRITSIFRTQ